ncbi:MAG: hypothetical protein JNL52_03510 [Flavobacteriales bacterium]|nr:hypothetical protein [Flavobacteriales bacterium]
MNPDVWVPLTILALTWIGKWIYDYVQEQRRIKRLLRYFMFCLTQTEETAINHVRYLRAFRSVVISKVPRDLTIVKINSGVALELIQEIGFKDLYLAHRRKARKEFSVLIAKIKLVPVILNKCEDEVAEFFERQNSSLSAFNGTIGKLQAFHNELALSLARSELTQVDEEYFRQVDRILSTWQRREDYMNPFVKHDLLFNELHKVLRLNPGLVNSTLFRLNEIWQEGNHSFTDYTSNKKRFGTSFILAAIALNKTIRDIRRYREISGF